MSELERPAANDVGLLPDVELNTQMALVAAMKKAVSARYEELRREVSRRLVKIHEAYGANGFDLRIGPNKVGKASFGKPTVGTDALGEYDRWAWETGRGSRELVVEASSHAIPPEALDEIREIAESYGADCHLDYKAFPELTRSLKVSGETVVDSTGEVVPGAYVKPPNVRITGCKPEEVGEALRLAGEDYTISGLLEA